MWRAGLRGPAGTELGMEEKTMGTGEFETVTHTVRVQDGSGRPAGLKPRSESSEPGRDRVERRAIGPSWFFGARSRFAKNTARHSLAPPGRAAGRVFVRCSWSGTGSHLGLWLGAARVCSFRSRELPRGAVSHSPAPSLPQSPRALLRSPLGRGMWLVLLKGVSTAMGTQGEQGGACCVGVPTSYRGAATSRG